MTKSKVDQAALVRVIGGRFRDARELCNMSQQRAAEALGYSNGSKLAKIEGATDTNSVPLYLIEKAARLYDVSADFLFGLTADWERDGGALEDREAFGYLIDKRQEDRKRDEEAFGRLSAQMRAVASAMNKMGPLIELMERSLERAKRDPGFDGIQGGAGIQSGIERAAGVFKAARLAFCKTKLDMDNWKVEPNNGFAEAVREMAGMSYIDREFAIRATSKAYQLPAGVIRGLVEREVRARGLVGGSEVQQLELSV